MPLELMVMHPCKVEALTCVEILSERVMSPVLVRLILPVPLVILTPPAEMVSGEAVFTRAMLPLVPLAPVKEETACP